MLIVEDTETSRELLETLLRSWSIPPVSVATAEEGLALLEHRNRKGGTRSVRPRRPRLDAAGHERARRRRAHPRARGDAHAADRADQRLRGEGGRGALRRAGRQRLSPQADHRLVAVRRGRRGAGCARACVAPGARRAARAGVRRARAAGRGQRGQPDGGERDPGAARDRARHRQQRPRGAGHGPGRPGQVRRGPDGHADAGDGRARRDAGHARRSRRCTTCRSSR